jgi:hypothetical protein
MTPQLLSRVQHKPTGKWYWMLRRKSWGIIYYSFDTGDTWHNRKLDAFNRAEANGRLELVSDLHSRA